MPAIRFPRSASEIGPRECCRRVQLDREIIGIEEFVLVQDREFEAERGAQYRLLRWRDRANERIQYVEAQVKGLDRVT
jgi:hypothetical protein